MLLKLFRMVTDEFLQKAIPFLIIPGPLREHFGWSLVRFDEFVAIWGPFDCRDTCGEGALS